MSLKDISLIDMTYTTPDGITGLMGTAFGWTPESLRLAQLGMKLSVMWDHGQQHEPFRIEFSCKVEEPPESAVGLASLVGGVLFWGAGRIPAEGRPGEYPKADLDWPAIHAANAELFARQHDLDGSLDSLLRLDEILAEAHLAAAENPGADGWLKEDGDLAMLAGAYASQVALDAFGGAWQAPNPQTGLPEFRVNLGRDGASNVGLVGKVRKFLQNGPGDAVHPAVMFLAEHRIVV